MKKTLAAATVAALVGVAGAANAADMYSPTSLKDGPVFAADPSWTGFYLGVGAGGGFVNNDIKGSVNPFASAELNGASSEGAFGTVQVGYDRQFGRFVGGVFFNYDFGDDISTNANLNLGNVNVANASIKLDDSWAVGGRLGYLVNNDTLVYGLAAYTEGDFKYSANIGPDSVSKTFTPSGYSVGAGIETKLGGNWFLRGEYRFSQYDTQTLLNLPVEVKTGRGDDATWTRSALKITNDADVQTVRAVLSYKANLFDTFPTPLK